MCYFSVCKEEVCMCVPALVQLSSLHEVKKIIGMKARLFTVITGIKS